MAEQVISTVENAHGRKFNVVRIGSSAPPGALRAQPGTERKDVLPDGIEGTTAMFFNMNDGKQYARAVVMKPEFYVVWYRFDLIEE